jgi:(4S)-4-hydroxy-5-phosphonooxypentane-2,3-dione isomerase
MHIVLVHIHIKPEAIEGFKKATTENARNSAKEPGVAQFSFLQQSEDPSRFTLVEAYRTPDDQLKHRETKHYQVWKDAVADMMADPRQGIKYVNVYPGDAEWK